MSTSDQNGQGPLTRKQLREIRLTGSTPVITPDEAAEAAAAAAAAESAPPRPRPVVPPSPVDDTGEAPLTRRQIREREQTGSVVVESEDEAPQGDDEAPEAEAEAPAEDKPLVTAVPAFAAPATTEGDAPVEKPAESDASEESEEDHDDDPAAAVAELGIEAAPEDDAEAEDDGEDDVLSDVAESDDVDLDRDERPTVNSAFGKGVLDDAAPEQQKPFAPSFDELLTVGDSTGSHRAGNALIFTPGPGEGSLSGPVASTGEILVTGSYELPRGLGSRGHADGTTDGKDVDAVLIDGELPPASSPTPIAASSAISTIKPAGEVIRTPAPEKGNRLTLILAIVTGGLALAVGVVVVIALTTNVF